MTPTRKLIVEVVDNIVYLALFYGLLAVPMYLSNHDTADLWRLGLIVVPFAGSFLLRRVVKRMLLALPIHMIFPVMAFFMIDELLPRMLWILAMVAVVMFSLGHYFRREPGTGPGFLGLCAGIFIVLALWAAQAGHWPLVAVYPALIMVTTIGRLAVLHMVQMDHSLEAVGLSSSQPVRRIVRFDYKLVAGGAVVIALLTFVVYFAVTGPLMAFISGIIPGLPEFTPHEATQHEMSSQQFMGADTPMPGLLAYEGTEPSLLFQILGFILRIMLAVVSVTAAAIILYLIARAIFRWFNHRAEHFAHDIHDVTMDDEREFILPMRNKAARVRRTSQEHPLRRRFRETVVVHIKKGASVKKSDTPTDITAKIHSEDISALAEEYSGVRYK